MPFPLTINDSQQKNSKMYARYMPPRGAVGINARAKKTALRVVFAPGRTPGTCFRHTFSAIAVVLKAALCRKPKFS
jgi:hypothetical protein